MMRFCVQLLVNVEPRRLRVKNTVKTKTKDGGSKRCGSWTTKHPPSTQYLSAVSRAPTTFYTCTNDMLFLDTVEMSSTTTGVPRNAFYVLMADETLLQRPIIPFGGEAEFYPI